MRTALNVPIYLLYVQETLYVTSTFPDIKDLNDTPISDFCPVDMLLSPTTVS